jgi:SUKH-4 immunity protein
VLTEEDANVWYGVDVDSGEVFDTTALAPQYIRFFKPDRIRFFNSDIAALVFFLGRLERLFNLEVADEHTVPPAVQSLRASLRVRDPAAMTGKTPWSILLDELESQTG